MAAVLIALFSAVVIVLPIVLAILAWRSGRRSSGSRPLPVGYAPLPQAEPVMTEIDRMQLVYRSGGFLSVKMEIYKDTHTGAEYLVVTGGSGIAVTPMAWHGRDTEEERTV